MKKDVGNPKLKPTRIDIPNSLYSTDIEDHTICLFCRSEDKEKIQEFLATNPIDGLTKIVSLNEVKKHYVLHKDKKQLLKEHTHFLCDARIMSHLYNLLGKVFGARSSYPIPIAISANSRPGKGPAVDTGLQLNKLEGVVMKAVNSTYMHLSGRNITIRFGHTGMGTKSVIENIMQGMPVAVTKFKNEWKDVMNIYIKTNDSPSLPLYSKSTDIVQKYLGSPETSQKEGESLVGKGKTKKTGATPKSGKKKSVK